MNEPVTAVAENIPQEGTAIQAVPVVWDRASLLSEQGELVTRPVGKAYIIAFDTSNLRVHQMMVPEPLPDPIVFQAALVNIVEEFAGAYRKSIGTILAASVEVMQRNQRLNQKSPFVDPNMAMQYMAQMNNRLEDFLRRVNVWDHKTEISIILPYAHIHFGDDGHRPDQVNFEKTIPYVNGLIFVASYPAKNGVNEIRVG